MTIRERLAAIVQAAPPDATVTVRWLAELLAAESQPDAKTHGSAPVAVHLTVTELAARLKRKPSTVRTWCSDGDLPGSYRNRGREWRIPPAAIEAMQHAQAKQHTAATRRRSRRSTTDIGAWREHMPEVAAS